MNKQSDILDLKHITNPEVGDYWSERIFNGVCVVLKVTNTILIICKTKKAVDQDHWTWDLNKTNTISRQDFKKWLAYGNHLPNKFWASVYPKQHLWAVEEYNKNCKAESTYFDTDDSFICCPI